MSNNANYAPEPATAALKKYEATATEHAEKSDERKQALKAIGDGAAKDVEAGLAARENGETLKNPRANTDAAEAALAMIETELAVLAKAEQLARKELYTETVTSKQAWLESVKPVRDEARQRLATNLAACKDALRVLAGCSAVERFLEDF